MGLLSWFKNLVRSTEENSEIDLDGFQQLIGYRFNNPDLLILGLTHRSVARSSDQPIPSNERLEFLGDSVLDLIIADQLFKDYPQHSEGDLTKMKAMLVNETTLARIGIDCGLNKYIIMSSEEAKNGGHERPSIVSDAFEAVIGAIFLDGGIKPAEKFVKKTIYIRQREIFSDDSQRNYKGDLLELLQARGECIPRYETVSETGPDHDKQFLVRVIIGDKPMGEGVGSSKKEAEQKAASCALELLK